MLKKTGATYFHITIADMNAKINSSTEQRSIIADVWVDELLWNPVSIICGERVRERNGKAEKNCYYREIVSRDQYLILDRGYLENDAQVHTSFIDSWDLILTVIAPHKP